MRGIIDMDYRRIILSEKWSRFMRGRVDNFLYKHGIPTDWYFLGMLPLGKFVQGRATEPLRFAHICTGPGGVLHSYRVDSHVML
jgi:hypothetical protein